MFFYFWITENRWTPVPSPRHGRTFCRTWKLLLGQRRAAEGTRQRHCEGLLPGGNDRDDAECLYGTIGIEWFGDFIRSFIWLVVWNTNFMTLQSVWWFSIYWKIIIPTALYFSEGLKPPSRYSFWWFLIDDFGWFAEDLSFIFLLFSAFVKLPGRWSMFWSKAQGPQDLEFWCFPMPGNKLAGSLCFPSSRWRWWWASPCGSRVSCLGNEAFCVWKWMGNELKHSNS